jgi:hypothetical protein
VSYFHGQIFLNSKVSDSAKIWRETNLKVISKVIDTLMFAQMMRVKDVFHPLFVGPHQIPVIIPSDFQSLISCAIMSKRRHLCTIAFVLAALPQQRQE